jgi:hippurate hydrolase
MPIIPHIAGFQADMVAWRRQMHAHPETAFEEHLTAGLVARTLAGFGIEVHRGLGGTGVVGVLRGGRDRDGDGAGGDGGGGDGGGDGGLRAIGLRADMDALPLAEANTFAHVSRHAGRMHACGHDGHTAMLLGAARYLAETRRFNGSLRFIFQPAEEGRGGARRMIEDGLFRRFPCEAVYGLHNWPELPAGTFAVHPGPVMAAADQFTIKVEGHGVHAAMPHRGVDPVLVAAHIVTAVQSLISRNTDPLDSAVISVTVIQAGTAFNIIPADARLDGTVRTFTAATRDRIESQLERLATSIAAGFGARATLTYNRNFMPTVNTVPEAERAAQAAALVVGDEGVRWNPPPSMTAEDFGCMLDGRPGCYVWLGQGKETSGCGLHSPHYDFNDEVLAIGASYWATLAETLLPETSPPEIPPPETPPLT